MKFKCTILAASLAVVGSAAAQTPDFPSTGIVYNTKDAAALTHFCKLSPDRVTMDCEFTQTSIRRKLNASDAAKKLADARAEFATKPQQVSEKECAGFENLLLILQGKQAAPDPQGMAKMSAREKANGLAVIGPMVSFCRVPNIDNWMKMAGAGIDKDKRTCLLSSHSFKQKFRQADTSAWIVVAQPEGPCGVVELSRFEPEKSSTVTFWNYISRKAVTNPNASIGSATCKMLDEGEYKYQWQKKDPDLNCEYVEFSVF
jgi:hypothetical protein